MEQEHELIKSLVKLKVYKQNEEGKEIVLEEREFEGKSFVFNFMQQLFYNMKFPDTDPPDGKYSAQQVIFAYYDGSANQYDSNIRAQLSAGGMVIIHDYGIHPAAQGDNTIGIVIGNGTGTLAIGDVALWSEFAPNVMQPQKQSMDNGIIKSGNTVQFSFYRNFLNVSNTNQTVTEIGIKFSVNQNYQNVTNVSTAPTTLSTNFLIYHDVISPAVTVPPNAYILIQITIQVST